jgi:hypothetical protein
LQTPRISSFIVDEQIEDKPPEVTQPLFDVAVELVLLSILYGVPATGLSNAGAQEA